MAESIVSFLLENLPQLLAHEANLLCGVEDKVTSLHNELRMIDAFLKYAERKKISNEIFDEVVNQIKDAAHDSEDVIDAFVGRVTKQRRRNILGRIIHSVDHAKMFHEVAGKIEMLKNKINEIHSNKIKYNIEDNEATTAGEDNLRRDLINRRRRNVEEDQVVGFSHDSSVVIQRLMEGGSHSRLTVVSIIGMGGLGKTTLARKIYNNKQVEGYFDCRAWLYVTNDYRPRELLLSLLKCLNSVQYHGDKGMFHSLSEDELKNEVRNCLIGKRYLIVLDDIWKPEDWDEIRDIFPDDRIGSRVLITSRLKELASYTSCTPPYNLPFLSAEESWELFCKKVFRGEGCPSDLEPLGRKIAESCHGLPLSIVILSGLLANKEKSLREWSKIMDHVNWYLTQDETPVKDIVLKLSYDSLPRRLKPCFLYFGVFPEDFEVRVRPLIQKWVAEGFIQQSGTRNPEDVAEDYLYELVDRSLIQVASLSSDGGAKTCWIHDLLRDLCIHEGEKDKFFEVCTDTNILTRTRTKPRRLSAHCSTPSCVSSSNCDHSCTRTLICFSKEECKVFTSNHWKWLVKGFQLVRVLDIAQGLWFHPISSKLEALIHLRYLRLDCYIAYNIIPDSICNLWNLETLDLGSPRYRICLVFPSGMWKLKKLRHLHAALPLILSDFSESDTKIMWNLQTLSNVALNKAAMSLIQKGMFPNLTKLGLFVESKNKWKPPQLLQNLKHLTHLNTLRIFLDLDYDGPTLRYASVFPLKADTFPSSITKIKMENITSLDADSMRTIGNLTNLRILKLFGHFGHSTFFADKFDLNFFAGWFPQLQVFVMGRLGVQNWELANGAIPRLQRLVISDCYHLISLPNELWSLSALRQVQVLQASKKLTLMLQNLEMKDGCELIIHTRPN